MKVWKVDNYCIGPAEDSPYDTTAETLAYILNQYEKAGASIKEVIETKKGNFRIIYTVEDTEYFKENFCK